MVAVQHERLDMMKTPAGIHGLVHCTKVSLKTCFSALLMNVHSVLHLPQDLVTSQALRSPVCYLVHLCPWIFVVNLVCGR